MADSKKSETVTFGHYCVALIDILGQREELQKLKHLPSTEDERQEFIQLIKQTFGVIDGIRKLFESFYSGYSTPTPIDPMLKTNLKFQTFSDTIIIYLPLATIGDHIPLNSIYAAVLACGATFLDAMATGHPLRGGIEIGVGAEIYEGEIYGPALSDAYRLESRVAQYPRIIVGNELLSYLWAHRESKEADLRAKFASGMSQYCLELFTQDVDGHPIVDYLGEGFMKRVDYLPLRDDTVANAYQFVNKEAKKWRDLKNTELASRYALLRNYFRERLAIWNARSK